MTVWRLMSTGIRVPADVRPGRSPPLAPCRRAVVPRWRPPARRQGLPVFAGSVPVVILHDEYFFDFTHFMTVSRPECP
jgi:hypothetical protein